MRFDMPESKNVVSSQSEIKIVEDIYILDASGSMQGAKFSAAIEGIKQGIKDTVGNPNGIQFNSTLCLFNSSITFPFIGIKPDDVTDKMLNLYTSGLTKLLDAVGETINRFSNTPNNVLIKIFTDGDENASNLYKYADIEKLISEKKDLGWTITFVGTKEDVATIINRLKISKDNTLVHDNTASGIEKVFKTSRGATMNYTKSLSLGTNNNLSFFTPHED